MADQNVQRFYDSIIIRGRRNAPSYNEARREVTALTERISDAALYRF